MNRHLKVWLSLSEQLNEIKSEELKARMKAIEKVFVANGLDRAEGTVSYPNDDYMFKAVFRMNYSVMDEDGLRTFLTKLPEWQRPRLVKYRPELQLGEYRKLDPKLRARLKNYLSIKAGTPGLTAEPK